MTTVTSSATINPATTEVVSFRAEEGCQAHLVIDRSTREAVAIDPRLDQTDQVRDAAEKEGAAIRYVLDTHTHADHLSGVRRLSRETGARVLAHPGSRVDPDTVIQDGEVFRLGETPVRVIHSAGHTPDSLSLLIDGHLFTGDALLAGSAGRTDFMGGSAGDLYDSFRKFEALPDETIVHPGHDYVGRPTTTIGSERRENPLMREGDREKLVERMSARGPLPANMKAILAFNTRGPSGSWVVPLELQALLRLNNRVRAIDIRSRSEFARNRIETATNVPLEEIGERIGEIAGEGEIVLVCRSGMRSQEAARILEARGLKTRQLEGGMVAWNGLGLPWVGRGGMSVDRQVQLTVGAGVLLGSALTVTMSPWFAILPAFFGAGLTFAGLSGKCSLAYLLARMPWNRHPNETGSACGVATTSACSAGSTPDLPKRVA